MAQDSIIRRYLLTAELESKTVTKIEIKEINLNPQQKAGLHKHPCPVVGYIAEGNALFQVKGEPAQNLKSGDAFYDPADAEILHFDNASDTKPLKFIASYLLNGEQELIQMLPEKHQ